MRRPPPVGGAARAPARGRAVGTGAAGMGGAGRCLWALDFDGVLCNSEPESSASAWRAGLERWPEVRVAGGRAGPQRVRGGVGGGEGGCNALTPRPHPWLTRHTTAQVFGTEAAAARRAEVLAAMGRVRPVVETGFENMLLVRLLLEGEAAVPEILAGWRSMLPQWMAAWGLERQEMVEYYGRVRDEWISSDLEGWLAPNEFYAGVPEAVNAADPAGLWIVTTKQARFTSLLLNDMAKISTIPDDRILSTTVSGVRTATTRSRRPPCPTPLRSECAAEGRR